MMITGHVVVAGMTPGRKVPGSSPALAAGEFSLPWSAFCADFYFGIRSTPRVTAAARKRSRPFCQ